MKRNHARLTAAVLLLTLDIQAALAKSLRMTCSNPRREYLVTFDAEKGTLTATADEGPTPYSVSSFTTTSGQTVVSGHTPHSGPAYTAYFGKRPRIEFNFGSGFQTDLCRTK